MMLLGPTLATLVIPEALVPDTHCNSSLDGDLSICLRHSFRKIPSFSAQHSQRSGKGWMSLPRGLPPPTSCPPSNTALNCFGSKDMSHDVFTGFPGLRDALFLKDRCPVVDHFGGTQQPSRRLMGLPRAEGAAPNASPPPRAKEEGPQHSAPMLHVSGKGSLEYFPKVPRSFL